MFPQIIGTTLANKAKKVVLAPLEQMVDDSVTDIVTTIGSFVIRSVRGKFQRSITFTSGSSYYDWWMEEALYGIIYQYNDIKKTASRLRLTNEYGESSDGSGMYYQLDDGTHNLKYRDWDILLVIQTVTSAAGLGNSRVTKHKVYTIITFDLDPNFVTSFERDIITHRNSLLRIRSNSSNINVYEDYHESDGTTYWEKQKSIACRSLGTIYMPDETKRTLIRSINRFFASKDYYRRHGISHNMKILLYGPPGPQPLDEMVATPRGYQIIGSLKPGDEIYDDYADVTTIAEIYEYQNQRCFRIEFTDGASERCGITHRWPVYQHGNLVEMALNNIIEDGWDSKISSDISMENRELVLYEYKPGSKTIEIPYFDGSWGIWGHRVISRIVQEAKFDTMRCLHLNGDRHRYLTKNQTVSCNSGKDSIAKMIASEWNRNLYYVTGGKGGRFIPNAISSAADNVVFPLFLISDIDKYPFLINEPDIQLDKDGNAKDESMQYKQSFANMINALDGIMSQEGRIILMTTNHIEKFSDTFLRPGRVDLKLEIGYVSPEVFRKYVLDFYGIIIPENIKLRRDDLTIAEMQRDVVFMQMPADEFIKKYVKDE